MGAVPVSVEALALTVPRPGAEATPRLVRRVVAAPGPGQLRVRTVASACNPVDLSFLRGRLRSPVAPAGGVVLGMELAGVVEAVGLGTSIEVGRRVVGVTTPLLAEGGAHAELVLIDERSVAPVDRDGDLVAASTVAMNGLTARLALDRLALPPGAGVVVTGAAGALGGYVIETAKADGLVVTAQSSAADRSLVVGLGADHWVERGNDWSAAARDLAGGRRQGLVDAAALGAAAWDVVNDAAVVAVRPPDEVPVGVTVHTVSVREYLYRSDLLRQIVEMARDGRLTPRVHAIVSPAEAGDALRRLAAGGVRGRFVVRWGGGVATGGAGPDVASD